MNPSLTALLRPHLPQFDNSCLAAASVLVGLDGFIDEMACIVDKRRTADDFEPVPTIAAFGHMVAEAAGRSFGREVVVSRVEAGGNAPNLAEGLMCLGIGVDFYGTLGDPLDPVFGDFAKRCRTCHTLGPCGRTLALEFSDGKLMLNNTGRLGELTPRVIERAIAEGGMGAACQRASLLGLVNWSRYPHMTAVWRTIRERVGPTLRGRPWLMIDLADPGGRGREEIKEMLGEVTLFQRVCRVVLGMNLHESGVVARTLGEREPTDEAAAMTAGARALRQRLGVERVVIHSQRRAAGAWEGNAGSVEGAYTPNPVRATGVGDRFNAGVCAGLLGGLAPEACVALGCAAGAWFVTRGQSASLDNLREMVG